MKKTAKIFSLIVAFAMVFSLCAVGVMADEVLYLAEGTYDITDYTTLYCYVNAMGGVDFAADTLEGASLTVDADGNATLTLSLGSTSGTIYMVTYTAFVSDQVTPSYYDADGNVQAATYTLSSSTLSGTTLTMGSGKYVYDDMNYVDSMTFPVVVGQNQNYLRIFINSSVMGCLFCDGSGTGASNQIDTDTSYVGSLTIDWDAVLADFGTVDPNAYTQNAEISYTYAAPNTFEVSIPATISLGSDSSASYTIEAVDFALDEGATVTVTAPAAGTLTSGENSVAFANSLTSGVLSASGDILTGVISVGTPEAYGDYTGTLTFTISFVAAE